MRKTALRLGAALIALAALVAVDFFFNPLGLGPEPEVVLGEAFYATTAAELDRVQLLVDGREAFTAIHADLESAQSYVLVQTYIWKDDETGKGVVTRLRALGDRGVDVEVRKDMLGTVFELGDVLAGTPSPVFTEDGLLDAPGIQVQNSLTRDADHSKYFLVDSDALVFGGMNIADDYQFEWHDFMVRAEGDARIERFVSRVLDENAPTPGPERFTVNDGRATEIRAALVEVLDRAERRVIVQHAYISDEPVVAAIERAAARGVAVDLIVPREPDTHGAANKVTLNRLMAQPTLRVLLFPEMSHAKVLLVDDSVIAIGSANLTLRSMATSRELTWFAHAPPDAQVLVDLQAALEADIARCTHQTEPLPMSLSEQLMAPVDRILW